MNNSKQRSGNGKGKTKRPNKGKYRSNTKAKEVELSKDSFPDSSKDLRTNDPNWYIADPTMFRGVISMPTLDFKGVNAIWPDSEGMNNAFGTDPNAVLKSPTVVGYYMNPSASVDLTNPSSTAINICARSLYAELSASNAKTSQYAPQDVTMLILSLGQILAITNFLKRAYGITNYFNFYNRTIPTAMMKLHNMSPTGIDNWVKHMPEFRARLNKVISRINTIQFPSNIDYFNKCEYVYNNVYVDRDDNMPTFQMMIPYTTWFMDETSSPSGTYLQTLQVCNGATPGNVYNSPTDLVLILEAMVEAILQSSTFNYIYADVINLANRNVLHNVGIHVDPVEIDYTTQPLYSEQFNWQVMNMSILNVPNASAATGFTASNDVESDPSNNAIFYNPRWTISGGGAGAFHAAVNSQRPLPVRLPNTDISDDEFVELLAYHNYPTITSIDVNNASAVIQYDGLSDYYCVLVDYLKGNDVSTPTRLRTHFIISNNFASYIPHILNVVHAPIFGMSDANTGALSICSKLGAYTFTDAKAISNLRYQTFLGLFRIKNR